MGRDRKEPIRQDLTDWRLIKDKREKYAAYLASRDWAILKEKVRGRSGGLCEVCRLRPMEQVHHVTYIRQYREELNDLRAICGRCHERNHAKGKFAQVEETEKLFDMQSYLDVSRPREFIEWRDASIARLESGELTNQQETDLLRELMDRINQLDGDC